MRGPGSSRRLAGTLLFIVAGPILWAAGLALSYGMQSSLCAFAPLPPPAVGALVIAITAILIAADVIALVLPRSLFRLLAAAEPDAQWPFIRTLMQLLGALSALALIYFALAALLLPACAPLR